MQSKREAIGPGRMYGTFDDGHDVTGFGGEVSDDSAPPVGGVAEHERGFVPEFPGPAGVVHLHAEDGLNRRGVGA